METFPIIRLGNPVLRNKSKKVSLGEIKTKKFQEFLDKLSQTCNTHDGVGIAAPQVGVLKRVIVVVVDPKNPRYENKKPFPLSIIVNPEVVGHSSVLQDDWEGDLSANIRGLVPRPISCLIKGLDREGKEVKYDLSDDFHARVFQHEIDHLDGILFLDKVKRKKSFSEYETWKKFWKGKPIHELPF